MIPTEILTNTTVEFSITPSDRPTADGYSYVFKLGGAFVLVKDGTINGDAVDFKISPSDTENFTTGTYFYQIFAEKVTDRYLIDSNQISVNQTILDNGTYDGRTVAEKILAAIDACILGRATSDQQSYTIQSGAGSRSLSRIPVSELQELRKSYVAIVNAEKRNSNGGKLFTPHYAEFVKR